MDFNYRKDNNVLMTDKEIKQLNEVSQLLDKILPDDNFELDKSYERQQHLLRTVRLIVNSKHNSNDTDVLPYDIDINAYTGQQISDEIEHYHSLKGAD